MSFVNRGDDNRRARRKKSSTPRQSFCGICVICGWSKRRVSPSLGLGNQPLESSASSSSAIRVKCSRRFPSKTLQFTEQNCVDNAP